MSVLVRGMNMPKNCCECKLILWDGGTYICPFSGIMALSIGIQDDCPLVEIKTPHGRLIDATGIDNATATKEDYPDGAILIPKGAILAAPTIIEAEE